MVICWSKSTYIHTISVYDSIHNYNTNITYAHTYNMYIMAMNMVHQDHVCMYIHKDHLCEVNLDSNKPS